MIKVWGLPIALMLAVTACDRRAAAPEGPARLSEQWQSVRLATSKACGRLACLVGLSGNDRPTTVSVRLVPFPAVRDDPRCRPTLLAPGLEPPSLSIGAWLSEALRGVMPLACPPLRTAVDFQAWRRSDSRNPFEQQNSLPYGYLPAGFAGAPIGRHIRCAIIFDPSMSPFDVPTSTLQEAAEICAALFYFREGE